MNLELQKRPFVRPLFFWILGIVVAAYVSQPFAWVALWLIVLLFLLASFFIPTFSKAGQSDYSTRWVRGTVLFLFLFILSIVIARISQYYAFPSTGITSGAENIRQYLLESIDRLALGEREKSVLSTLILGYKKVLPSDVRERFSIAGVSHILAVSGFHVAVVAGFLSLLFRALPSGGAGRWVRYIFLMGGVWCYVFITGMAVSSLRAGIMFSFYQTGKVIRRSSDSYNTLAASAFCMLAYRPIYLFDIGFQLSYVAVFFILYLQPRMQRWIRVRNPLLRTPWQWITVTVAAQTGTMFLCLYYFGRFSLFFLYANLPVIFFANLLIPLGLLWLLLPEWVPGYSLLQYSVEKLTTAMMNVVDFISSVPGASLHFSFGFFSLVAAYTMIYLFILYSRNKRPLWLLLALGCLFLLFLLPLIEGIVR